MTWWSGTTNSLNHDRFGGLKFDIQGVSPIGYTLFAATLGLASGVLWRRTLPAIATTLAASSRRDSSWRATSGRIT